MYIYKKILLAHMAKHLQAQLDSVIQKTIIKILFLPTSQFCFLRMSVLCLFFVCLFRGRWRERESRERAEGHGEREREY